VYAAQLVHMQVSASIYAYSLASCVDGNQLLIHYASAQKRGMLMNQNQLEKPETSSLLLLPNNAKEGKKQLDHF